MSHRCNALVREVGVAHEARLAGDRPIVCAAGRGLRQVRMAIGRVSPSLAIDRTRHGGVSEHADFTAGSCSGRSQNGSATPSMMSLTTWSCGGRIVLLTCEHSPGDPRRLIGERDDRPIEASPRR